MFVKLLYSPEGRVLGAQIVGGEGVDKRIDALAISIRFGMSIYDLEEMELAYAPPFSSAKDPVNMAGYVAARILAQNGAKVYDLSGGYAFFDARHKDLTGQADKGGNNCAACGMQITR